MIGVAAVVWRVPGHCQRFESGVDFDVGFRFDFVCADAVGLGGRVPEAVAQGPPSVGVGLVVFHRRRGRWLLGLVRRRRHRVR